MDGITAKIALIAVLSVGIGIVGTGKARAQASPGSVTGQVKSESGQVIAGAKVSVKSVTSGEAHEAQTDSTGQYSVTGLPAGDYEVAVSAPGFSTETHRVTLAAGATQTMDMKLAPELSVGSLGFPTAQTQGSAQQQALLDRRSHMLQVHQKLGLITAFPMAATLISSTQAGGRHSSDTGRNVHIALGSATTGLYAATAYYAIFAPRVKGEPRHGPTRFHEVMAFIHGPGMVMTPVLGAMAASQLNNGERVHGIASAHGEVAVVTAAAYGLALISETKPNWIPGLGHKFNAVFAPHRSSSEQASSEQPTRQETGTVAGANAPKEAAAAP